MKLAFVAAASSPHTIKWANALAKEGHDVTVYSLPDNKDALGELQGVRVEYLAVPGAQNGIKKNAKQLKELLAAGGYGAVVAMDMASYGYMAARAGAQHMLLVALGPDIYTAKQAGTFSMVKKSLKAAAGVLATSPNIITKIKELYKKDQHYFTVPFGVDMDVFRRMEAQKGDVPCFGSLKLLEPANGVEDVLKAFAAFVQNTGPARLKIVGGGSQADALQILAQSLGVEDSVEFCGYVKNADMPGIINSLDVVVQMPPEESFGVSGVEAMACCVPLVASDTYGASEYILNHVTGYLVKVGNTKACADKMAEAVRNRDMLKHMGTQAREDVMEHYTLADCVKKFVEAVEVIAG